MRIAVVMKQVPDLVEEFEVGPDGNDIDREYMSFVANEFDDQALEEALLVKDATGAEVVVVALDDPDIDQALYTALAKGADSAVKLTGAVDEETWLDTHSRAAALAAWLDGEDVDLGADRCPGRRRPRRPTRPDAGRPAGVPHVSVVVGVEVGDGTARVHQEFSGGVARPGGRRCPRCGGVAGRPPGAPLRPHQQDPPGPAGGRRLTEVDVEPPDGGSGLTVRRMYPPEQTDHAEMLTGTPGQWPIGSSSWFANAAWQNERTRHG